MLLRNLLFVKGGKVFMDNNHWRVENSDGSKRVIVTKELPGLRWLEILKAADCRVEICTSQDILTIADIKVAIGGKCDGAIGQLTEDWGEDLFVALKAAGGIAYSNFAVGFNNVDLDAATRHGIPVGNTPGVLTEATAEMCVALAFAAARRVPEADLFMRGGQYQGWLPTLFIGELFWSKIVGVIGMGRIGLAFAKMMAGACHMNVAYYDPHCKMPVKDYFDALSDFYISQGEGSISCTCCETLKELCEMSDLISINTILNDKTHHLVDAQALSWMKPNAVFINAARGPVMDEAALVEHAKTHPDFKAGLDVFEDEPAMKPGMVELKNVIVVPHIASATVYSREGMASLAASNVAAMLQEYPVWQKPDISGFLRGGFPPYAPSVVNAAEVGYPVAD
jgi:hydroxypyruvate reductase 1